MLKIFTNKKVKEIEDQHKKEIEEKETEIKELKKFSNSKIKELEDNYNNSLLQKDKKFHDLNKNFELNLELTDDLNKEIKKLNKQLVREINRTDDFFEKIEKEKNIFLKTKSGRIRKKYAKKILDKIN